jgi:predicted anti-sigma-YlaC factor YlaD
VNCRGVIAELTTYLDEAMDAITAADLERHLNGCKKCRLIVDTTRKTIEIYCNAEPVPLPQDVRDRLHKVLFERLGHAR